MASLQKMHKTIEDQIQLPVQTALPDNFQPGADDEADVVLVALEAQEDLGSGEDLLSAPEPQLEPVSHSEPVPETAAPTEAYTEPEAALPHLEKSVPVETLLSEATPVVEALVEEVTADLAVQAEAPADVAVQAEDRC
ncbi:hypothetical protein KUCAC02_014143 [Chaenocephalus aceratus]|uniref:Uncharacterized protein n=1 Tax=Chaenocephalus aceratus TaxID=36190 RepID=A0ACB9WEE1_CHAAC|nr:hypothetical protein KUCAC02_014143 [Chaenocephalus aceratus]